MQEACRVCLQAKEMPEMESSVALSFWHTWWIPELFGDISSHFSAFICSGKKPYIFHSWLTSELRIPSLISGNTLTSPVHIQGHFSSTVPCQSGLPVEQKRGHRVRFHPRWNLLPTNPKSCFRISQTLSLNKKGSILNQYKMINISRLSSEITESRTWLPTNHFHALRYLGCFLSPFVRVFIPLLGPATCWCHCSPVVLGSKARLVRDIKSPIHQLWGKKAWTLSISLATVSTESKDDCQWTGHLFSSFECNCLDDFADT